MDVDQQLKDNRKKADALMAMPASYQFSEKEMNFLKQMYPRSRFAVVYAFFKGWSDKKLPCQVIYDSHPESPRRSGVQNLYEFVCKRPVSDDEYDDLIGNLGTNNRRFKVYSYSNLEEVIAEDVRLGAVTPEKYKTEARLRGLTKM